MVGVGAGSGVAVGAGATVGVMGSTVGTVDIMLATGSEVVVGASPATCVGKEALPEESDPGDASVSCSAPQADDTSKRTPIKADAK